ncbi:hypothetical protein [uncultured Bacteroides sp.]|jgi:outer membrane biosynthesis protein TonB|uniref:hypothetical protein n=1 Tax=uncultured Bacteroides sp. TaxID=162156 RepID=UPI0025FA1AE9|nr:hypothetical protein [uncultured Bacteroides sp.]
MKGKRKEKKRKEKKRKEKRREEKESREKQREGDERKQQNHASTKKLQSSEDDCSFNNQNSYLNPNV